MFYSLSFRVMFGVIAKNVTEIVGKKLINQLQASILVYYDKSQATYQVSAHSGTS